MQETKFEAPNWNYIYEILIELAEKIKRSSFNPDVIVGISRGGWIPARILSDLLDNHNLANIRVEFYSDIYKRMKKPVITQSISIPVKDKRVLIVDDIIDTGESIHLVYKELSREAEEVKVVTLYYKPWSHFKPNYYSRNTDAWIIFPWELYETTKTLGNKMLKEGKSLEDIEEKLIKAKLSASMVKKLMSYIFREVKK